MTFDASDKDDEINLQNWPMVKGMYQPDAIVTFKTGGTRCEYSHHQGYGEWGCTNFMPIHSRMLIDPTIRIMAGIDHVGFSPSRHTLRALRTKRGEMFGEVKGDLHPTKNHV